MFSRFNRITVLPVSIQILTRLMLRQTYGISTADQKNVAEIQADRHTERQADTKTEVKITKC